MEERVKSFKGKVEKILNEKVLKKKIMVLF